MSDQNQELKNFFAMLAAHGVTNAFVVSPPPEAEGCAAKIETDGTLVMVDSRDGELKPISFTDAAKT